MQDWQNLSALVVGFGSIGRRHARVLKEIGVENIAVCEPMAELQEMARSEFGIANIYESYDDALATKPQTVFICSPSAMHIEQAMKAIRAGADVITEKPLSTSMDGVDELDAEAKGLGRLIMVAHCFRFHDGLMKAKKWLDEGKIGRLVSVRGIVGEHIPTVMPNYKNMYISQYSGVYELMHDIDLAIWYAGTKPERVYGVDGSYSDVGMTSPDLAMMLIEFADKRVASVQLDFFERVRHRQTEILGTEGTITIEFARWDKCVVSIFEAKTGEWQIEEIDTDRDDMFRTENRVFLESCISRSPVPVDISEGRKAIEVLLAAQKSARSGCAVSL